MLQMTPDALLTHLKRCGIVIFTDGAELKYRAPKGALTPDLRQALQQQKPALLRLLTPERPTEAAPAHPAPAPQAAAEVPRWEPPPAEWSVGEQDLIRWISTAEPPSAPFKLRPGIRVDDPAKFFRALRSDIAAGPDGPRARYGVLARDLFEVFVLCGLRGGRG